MKYYDVKETAARIRALRKINHYTQEQAAERLEIDRRALSYIESASRGCSLDLFIRMASVYDVSLDYLVLGERPDSTLLQANLDSVIVQLTALRDQL